METHRTRLVTFTKLGNPRDERVKLTVPYNGVEFEFIDPEWRGLARRAACTHDGVCRQDQWVAKVFWTTLPC